MEIKSTDVELLTNKIFNNFVYLISWRKEKRRRALLTTSKAQRSPPWSLSQWWPPATDHKMNTVLIQFPRGSVGKVEIAHA